MLCTRQTHLIAFDSATIIHGEEERSPGTEATTGLYVPLRANCIPRLLVFIIYSNVLENLSRFFAD